MRNRDDIPTAVLFVVAFLPRLALAALGPAEGGDTVLYRQAGASLRQNPGGAVAFADLPPLLPMLFALLPSDRWIALLIAIAGSLVAPVIYVAVARRHGARAGVLAGIACALEPAFLQWSRYLLTDVFGLLSLAVLLERLTAQPSAARAFTTGIACAVGFLTRAALALPSVVCAAAVVAGGGIRTLALVALGALLVIGPLSLRNVMAIGTPVPYRDQGLQIVYAGTMWNPVGRGTQGVDIHYPDGLFDLRPADREAFYRREIIAFVTDHPAEFIALSVRKLVWFWHPAYPEWSLTHRIVSTAYLSVLYAMAIVGMLKTWRDRLTKTAFAMVAMTALTASLTIVDYDARYRVPAELCLIVLAAPTASALSGRLLRLLLRRELLG